VAWHLTFYFPPTLQMILALPEIVDDRASAFIIEQLQSLLRDSPDLTMAVLDALTSLRYVSALPFVISGIGGGCSFASLIVFPESAVVAHLHLAFCFPVQL
jgi:hypothetical protein